MFMKMNKWYKVCLSIAMFFGAVIAAILFMKIPAINNLFIPETISSVNGIWLWALVWIVLALECSIIPGSYVPFLVFFAATPMADNKLLFCAICSSAVIIGRVGAYFVGKFFGNRLLKWAAEDSYTSWQEKLSGKAGKSIYAATVALPAFPDLVLSWVAGSISMNFWFYIFINALCKIVENILLIYLGITMGSGGIVWLFIYIGIIVTSLITAVILKIIMVNNQKNKN